MSGHVGTGQKGQDRMGLDGSGRDWWVGMDRVGSGWSRLGQERSGQDRTFV